MRSRSAEAGGGDPQKENDSNYATALSTFLEEVAYTWFNRLIAIRFMRSTTIFPSHIRFCPPERQDRAGFGDNALRRGTCVHLCRGTDRPAPENGK